LHCYKFLTVKADGLQVHLDKRPLKTPSKKVLAVPESKPHLASAIALEWDVLTSASQALKPHLIPLTSLTARALDIEDADAKGDTKTRDEITKMVMMYLDTDTLLCWQPAVDSTSTFTGSSTKIDDGKPVTTLREQQIAVAQPIIAYLATHLWPGVEILPTSHDSILPTPQPQMTKEIIKGWVSSLPPWELVGLERAVLAQKSLLGGVRFITEWSPQFRHLQKPGSESRFGIKEAEDASTVEVRWQTGMWGEVEDTHDVNKEDLRRQLGSVILLVSAED
jgi:chaperone required for assembly of F1-ATPase